MLKYSSGFCFVKAGHLTNKKCLQVKTSRFKHVSEINKHVNNGQGLYYGKVYNYMQETFTIV